jgi:hypothetical protein
LQRLRGPSILDIAKTINPFYTYIAGSSPLEGYEAEAEEFKRHCMRRGVTLSNIKEAFASSKPRVLPRAVVAQHAFAGKKYGW